MPVVTRDVKSLRKAGDTKLKGDVTLTGGDNVTLTQSGQDISIAAAAGAAGATIELDNLGTTAINTSLISDTDSTDDLGSTAKYWRTTYSDKVYLNSGLYLDGTALSNAVYFKNATPFVVIYIPTDKAYMQLKYDATNFLTFETNNTVTKIHGRESGGLRIHIWSSLYPNGDSVYDLGSSAEYWANTYTDKLALTNVGALAAAADKLMLGAIDLSAGNTILDINTEGTGVEGSGTPAADKTIAIRVNGNVRYLLASTVAT